MKKFQGEVSSESLVDILQFYVLNQSCVHVTISHKNSSGEVWINNGKIAHATTAKNFGLDAFYEMLGWENGTFKINLNVSPEVESISKSWTELILEYYVLVDENKITKFEEEINISNPSAPSAPQPFKKTNSASFKSIKDKLKTIMELDGVISASIVDILTGIPVIQISNKPEEFELYCAYMVEVVKSHKNFLSKLNIKDKIEDIIINLNNNYHIVTFILKQDNLFIYVVLDKENSNLGMTRLVLMKIEEELEL